MDPNVQKLFDDLSAPLALTWLAGKQGAANVFDRIDIDRGDTSLVGHFNLIHPNQVQVLGNPEMSYFDNLETDEHRDEFFQQLFRSTSKMVLVAGGNNLNDVFLQQADRTRIPLLQSPRPSNHVVNSLRYYFTNELADKTTLHGVFMEVISIGVLLTGESSMGKSELALELLTRGHRLVADDAPQFARVAPDIINGTCPPLLQDFLEVRGLGVLNVRQMYGDSAVKHSKYLRLIIHLKDQEAHDLSDEDRLYGNLLTRDVLGMEVPIITLPVAPGRNLAVLVEATVRNHLLRQQNYNSGEDFARLQRDALGRDA
ncbi:MAG: HPr(Ser) kinase/phosphatase [Gammaproteobacteria bacterium]